jgi:hypothetical protein
VISNPPRLAGLGDAFEVRAAPRAKLGGEAVADEPVTHLAGDLGHQLAGTGEGDLRHTDASEVDAGGEEGSHEGVLVNSPEVEWRRSTTCPRSPAPP